MQKTETEMDDELRPEYDLRDLRVRKVGSKRKGFSGATIDLVRVGCCCISGFQNSES